MRFIFNTIVLVLFLTFPLHSQQGKSLGTTSSRLMYFVTDETGTLTESEISSLDNKLKAFADSTSNQVVVYMISSLQVEPIEDVSLRIAEENLIGQMGKDNGVLLLIAKDDRKLRIEVGYGLEGALTDALANSIIRNEITPEFRNGNFYKGINNGVDAIIQATKGEYEAEETSNESFNIPSFIVTVIIFGFIFVMVIIRIIATIAGVGKSYRIGGGRSGFSGGFWGSGSGSSGSSFGSFSGGGGSFGGGGSSGSW